MNVHVNFKMRSYCVHIGHLWVFSPPSFILVWDVKDILQSSVKIWLPSIGAFNADIPLFYLQSYGSTGRKFDAFPEEMRKISGARARARAKVEGKSQSKSKTTN